MARIINEPTEGSSYADVTRESRITGATRRTAPVTGADGMGSYTPSLHWYAVLASVVVGVALSATLIILGVATGLIAGNEKTSGEDALGILGALGAWAVISVLLGSFIGSFVGGRLTRWMDRLSIAGHTLVSWGVATLLSILMLCVVTIAFSSATTSAATTATAADVTTDGQATEGAENAAANADGGNVTNAQTAPNSTTADEAADDTADALGGAGWALAAAMILSLLASAAGWFLGSRRKLTDIEREDDTPVTA